MSGELGTAVRASWRPWWAMVLAVAALSAGAVMIWWGAGAIIGDRPNQWYSGFGTVLGWMAIVLAAPPVACLAVYLVRARQGWFWAGIGLALGVTILMVGLIAGDAANG